MLCSATADLLGCASAETSAFNTQTPGKYPEDNLSHYNNMAKA
jgi:hypothetical protein